MDTGHALFGEESLEKYPFGQLVGGLLYSLTESTGGSWISLEPTLYTELTTNMQLPNNDGWPQTEAIWDAQVKGMAAGLRTIASQRMGVELSSAVVSSFSFWAIEFEQALEKTFSELPAEIAAHLHGDASFVSSSMKVSINVVDFAISSNVVGVATAGIAVAPSSLEPELVVSAFAVSSIVTDRERNRKVQALAFELVAVKKDSSNVLLVSEPEMIQLNS